jgi:hypothetical protein
MENSEESLFEWVEQDDSINPKECFELTFNRQSLIYLLIVLNQVATVLDDELKGEIKTDTKRCNQFLGLLGPYLYAEFCEYRERLLKELSLEGIEILKKKDQFTKKFHVSCLSSLLGIAMRGNSFLSNEPITEENKDEIEIGRYLFMRLSLNLHQIVVEMRSKLSDKCS